MTENLPKNFQGNILDTTKPIIALYGETEQELDLLTRLLISLENIQFIWLGKNYIHKIKISELSNFFSVRGSDVQLSLLPPANLLAIISENHCPEKILNQAIKLGLKILAFSSVTNIREIVQKEGYLLHGKPEVDLLLLIINQFFSSEKYKTNKPMDIQTEKNKQSENFTDYKNLGDKLVKEDRLAEAASAYQLAIQLKPDRANLYYLLAAVREKQGYLDEAIINYQQAVKLNPEDYWSYKLLGDIFSKQEQLDKAEEAYTKAISIKTDKASLYYLLANIQEKLGKLEQATNSYQRIIELNPQDSWSYKVLGDIFSKQERWEEAEKAYQQAINLKPEQAGLYYLIATIQEKQENLEKAVINYQKAIELNPQDYWNYKVVGDIFRQTGDFAQAESFYLKAIELNPDYANLYHLLAIVQKSQGRIQEAIASYRKAIMTATEREDIANYWHHIALLEEECWQLKDAYIAYIKSCCYQEKEDRKNKVNTLSQFVAQELIHLPADDPDLDTIINFFQSQIDKAPSSEKASFWVYQLLLLVESSFLETWLQEDSALGKKIKRLIPLAIAMAEENKQLEAAITWLSAIVKFYNNFSEDVQTWLAINIVWYKIRLDALNKNLLLIPLENEITASNFDFKSYSNRINLIDRDWLKLKEGIDILETDDPIGGYFNLEKTIEISPHPVFDVKWYQDQQKENITQNPYSHPLVDFLRRSIVQPAETNPSVYFDVDWYCEKYQIREGEISLLHYLKNFPQENVSPHPFFDRNYFRQTINLSQNIEPLGFYIKSTLKYGQKWHLQGPNPSPYFQRQFYLDANPKVKEKIVSENQDAYYHFITVGKDQNLPAHPWQSYHQFLNDCRLHPLESLTTAIRPNLFENLKGLKGLNAYLECIRALGKQLTYQPLISIIMPVYQVEPKFLQEAIASVKAQTYGNWQLCLVDDASERYRQEILSILRKEAEQDSRIVYHLRKENGHICRTSNDCLNLAKGDFIALVDHDDVITPDALYEVVKALNENTEIDILYSDEDKIDEWGVPYYPFYKPDWSPHSILSRMYVCHLSVYRSELIKKVGGFRIGFEGSQDHDLFLRCSEIARKIHHLPKVLYHWRAHAESTSGSGDKKSYASLAAKKAVEEHLQRRNLTPKVELIPEQVSALCPRIVLKENPLIDILIPSRDAADILTICLHSVFTNSSYQNFKITVIDNGSKTAAFKNLVSHWLEKEPQRFSVIPCDIEFNYSLINNIGVSKTDGEYLLLLNNDIEVLSEDWLEALLEYAQLPEVGAVGAKLLYPDRTIQHGGVIIGLGGIAGHVCKYFPEDHPGYHYNLHRVNNYSAVTGACLMVSREKFLAAGGLNEHLKVAFNDVDFCLKLVEKGYHNVYIPHVEIIHHESKSRGTENTRAKQIRFESEILYMRQRWQKYIQNDPCYSPYLTLEREDFSYRFH